MKTRVNSSVENKNVNADTVKSLISLHSDLLFFNLETRFEISKK